MDAQPVDYNVVLADLKSQREKLDAAIAGIETMLGMRTMTTQVAQDNTMNSDIGAGAFLGMTVVDATVKFLKAKRQNQRTEDIVAALRNGGIAFSSDNPINTVGSTLNRNWTQGGEIVRVARGAWGLAEWHPRLRKRPDAKNSGAEANGDSTEEPT